MENLFTYLGRFVSFTLMFLVCSFSNAATYYFSSSIGDDSRNNTQAQNSNTPWRSIQKLNSVFNSLQPGDKILFKSGDIFYGTITINKSGTSGAPISFGSYGSGEKPVLTGFKEIKNWVSKGGNLYEAQIPEINTALSTVLINNELQAMGRYPNNNASNSGYLTINSYDGNGTISSSGLQAPANLAGGEVVIRKNNWIIDRHLIYWHGGSSVNYNREGSYYNPEIGYGFFIQNHPATLDKHGEWYFDIKTKKLLIFYQGNPSAASIKVSTFPQVIINQNSASHISFNNLTIQGSNDHLVSLNKPTNFTFENCLLEYAGVDAIHAVMSRNLIVSNTTIENTLNGGIFLGWDDRSATIKNNSFRKTFTLAGMGQNGDSQGNGIFMSETTSDVLIENNKFLESGFNAIHFKGNNINIKNNFIDTFCFVKDDGGGIYTYTGPANTTFTNRKITNNIIINGIGAMDGTKPFSPKDFPYVKGIYLDLFSNGIDIEGNTIGNVTSIGIFLNNSRNISITNNKIFNTGYSVFFARDHLDNPTRNISMKNNELLNKDSNQVHLYLRSKDNNLGQIGEFDYNIYSRPVNESKTVRLETPGTNGLIDLQTWKDWYQLDVNSSKSPVTYDENKMDLNEFILFDYNHSNSPKSISLSGTYADLKGKFYSGSITIPAYSSVILLKTEAGPSNSAPTINITSPNANAQLNQGSNINITANATDTDGTITKVEFYNGNTLLGTDTSSPYSFTWSNLPIGNFTLTAKATDNKGTGTVSSPVNIIVVQKSSRSPFGGTEAIIPGTVEAENYDIGGQGVTYYDVDAGNTGGVYRSEDVDIHAATEGGHTVGWMNLGEWLEYSVNITTAGSYNLDARVAAFGVGGTFHIEIDGKDVTGPLKVPATGGWNTWGSVYKTGVNLPAGKHVLRFVLDSNGQNGYFGNLNSMRFSLQNDSPKINITAPSTNAQFTQGSSINITANATDTDGTITKVEFYNGNALLGTDTSSPYSFTWSNLPVGNFTLTAKATDNKGTGTISSPVNINVVQKSSRSPFGGTEAIIPGTVEAENYDIGGQGVTYYDVDAGNTGGVYRSEDVDIHAATEGGHTVGWMNLGEWLEYSVNITTAGSYDLDARVAAFGVGGTFHIECNGKDVTGPLKVPATGGWNTWGSVNKTGVNLPAGKHVLRFVLDSNGQNGYFGNLNSMRFTLQSGNSNPARSPFGGTEAIIPGTVEAENYDIGGQGVTFFDLDPGNNGGVYRAEDVDIQAATEGGYNVGWMKHNEWLEYTVNITTAGSYNLDARVASLGVGGTFHIECDGKDVTGPLKVPSTGEWNAWGSVNKTGVNLPAGKHVLRFVPDSNGQSGFFGNLNSMRFTLQNQTYRVTLSSNLEDLKGKPTSEFVSTKSEVGEKLIFMVEDEADAVFEYWSIDGIKVGDQALFDLEMPNKDINLTKHFRAFEGPEIKINLPNENSTIKALKEIYVDLEIKNNDATIEKIELYKGDSLLAELKEDSTWFNWKNIPEGNHKLVAKITDPNGKTYFSDPVFIKGSNYQSKDTRNVLLEYIIGPNPTHDYLNVFFTNLDGIYDFEFRVVSMNGIVEKTFRARPEESTVTIDVSDLINGVYILQLTSNGNSISTKKFIKK